MKKTLSDKLKSGIKYAKSSAGKALTIGGLGLASMMYSNDAVAQQKTYKTKGHDTGAKVINYKSDSEEKLEQKLFGSDWVYVQHIDKDKYDNDLNIGSLLDKTTTPLTNFKTENVEYFLSNGMYYYLPETDSLGRTLNVLKPKELACPKQDCDAKDGENKYVRTIKLENLVPEHRRIELGDGTIIAGFEVEMEKQGEKGKSNHYLVPLNDGQHFVSPEGTIYGTIYRGILEEGKIVVNSETSEISSQTSATYADSAIVFPKTKETKQMTGDFIFGVNANSKFNYFEGQTGFRMGPVAAGVNIGKNISKKITETTTEASPITGNYGYGKVTKENKLSFGPFAELHILPNGKVDPFVGAGMNFWTNEVNVVEGIKNSSGNWKPGSPVINTINEKEKSYRVYAGVSVGKVDVTAGFDTLEGVIGGVRVSIPISGGNK